MEHRPLVTVHAGPTPPPWDMTPAEDDAIMARHTCCVTCGATSMPMGQHLVFLPGLAPTGALTLLVAWCKACLARDKESQGLHRFLTNRYKC